MARLLAAERRGRARASPPSRTCRRPGSAPGRCRARAARSRGRCCSSRSRRSRVPQPARRLQLPGAQQHDRVAVDDPAAVVDEDGAVAVAVERDAQVGSPRSTTASRQRLGMGRAAVEVDVAPVGRAPDRRRRRSPRSREQARRHGARSRRWRSRSRSRSAPRRGAPGSAAARASRYGAGQVDRPRRRGASPPGTVHEGRRRSPRSPASSRSVNFSPAPENTLMPLSSNGLCDAEMTTPASNALLAGQVGDRRRRDDARARHGGTRPPRAPWASSRSIHSPDSRVSRPTSSRVRVRRRAAARAPAPRPAGGRSADRAEVRRPGRARRRCRTVFVVIGW